MVYKYENGEPFPANPVKDICDSKRAGYLAEFLRCITESPYGANDRRNIILEKCKKNSKVPGLNRKEYDGKEAIDAISEGCDGMFMFWDSKEHGTEGLCCYDVDRKQYLPGPMKPAPETFADSVKPTDTSALPLTLEIMSGSGARHFIYHNSKSIKSWQWNMQDWFNGIDSFTVAPGSKHRENGVYHIHEKRDIATISESDLPSGGSDRHTDHLSHLN